MTALAHSPLMAQQEALLKALIAPVGQMADAVADLQARLDTNDKLAPRGLQAYQANGHALAERSLRAAYPVVEMMLGSDNFNALARDLWHSHPPTCGDLALWGDALSAFLTGNDALLDVPYLPDVARAEWAHHSAASAPDAAPDPASFARLGAGEANGLSLTLAPGTTVISSSFPLASLILSHRFEEPSLADAACLLQANTAESVLIWRNRLRPCLARVSPVEAALINSLRQGQDLPTALDAALAVQLDDAEIFDFSHWLTEAVTRGLVTGVHAVPHPSPKEPTCIHRLC
jgi:hypothetical protein